MENLILKDINKKEFAENITGIDYNSFLEAEEVNGERSIEFNLYRTTSNKNIFEVIANEMIVEWQGQEYLIKSIATQNNGDVLIKKIKAMHVSLDFQFHFVEKEFKMQFEVENSDGNGRYNPGNKQENLTKQKTNAGKIWNFFVRKGLKGYQIAGILGNLDWESNGLRPEVIQSDNIYNKTWAYDSNVGGYGFGLAQWDMSRRVELLKFADSNFKKWQDLDIQLSFMWRELTTTHSAAWQALNKTKNLDESVRIWLEKYEIAGVSAFQERKKRAVKYLSQFGSNSQIFNTSYLRFSASDINFPFDPSGTNPNYPFAQAHYGIDLNYINEPVYSIAEGIAEFIKDNGNGFGNFVIIDAGGGIKIIYAHLKTLSYSGRRKVKPGVKIGISGNTGRSSGPHLHLEIRKNDVAFDPLPFLKEHDYGKPGGGSEDFVSVNDNDYDDTEIGDVEFDEDSDEVLTNYTLKQYLDFGFAKNQLGFTYEIVGDFDSKVGFKELGNENGLKYLQNGASEFDYIYRGDNKKIYIYSIKSFYEKRLNPMIYPYNTSNINVTVDTKKIETYIKGYGKEKTTKETKNYDPKKPKDFKYKGSFEKEGTWKTEEVGASYSVNFNATHGNEMLEFSSKRGPLGGVVEVLVDNVIAGVFETYSKNTETVNEIIATGLKKGNHKVEITFKGGIKNVDYFDKKPVMYVGTEKANILNTTAFLKGEDKYHTVAEYKSDNYNVFGLKSAPVYYSKEIEDPEELKKVLKNKINDIPSVEVTAEYTDNDININESVRLIHKPMGVNTEIRVVSVKKPHPITNKKTEVSFTNSKANVLKMQLDAIKGIKNNSISKEIYYGDESEINQNIY